ncbi:MAG TPA: hypothetical protein VKW08_13745 [Xanthobacteraceae bacterium]|jgi:hypothetical protein|nr:hypothetical protein [Xanthobacteraceae bacterium]
MRLSKLKLLLIAAIAGGALFIEHGNRMRIEAPEPVDTPSALVIACLVDASGHLSQECMDLIHGFKRSGSSR